jgi:hypothetical protein
MSRIGREAAVAPRIGWVGLAVTLGCSPSSSLTASSGTGGANAVGDLPVAGELGVAGMSVGGSAGAGASAGGATSGPAIRDLPPQTWTWVPFPEARCRDGSSTGIGINPNPASDKLVILLEGGGACFNQTTCTLNRASFGQTDFSRFAASHQWGGGAGIFNRGDAANPAKDFSFVYVPYCTGDVHAGNNPQGSIDPVGPQQFVGYVNVGVFLERIVPTFSGVTQVLLTGVSAGGFGAVANYVQVARAFGSVPVVMLDDSGPPMGAPYLAPCLAQKFLDVWGLDKTVLADCGGDCGDSSQYLVDFTWHLAKSYPSARFALVDSTGDAVISVFFGYGANDCGEFAYMPPDSYAAGLEDIRARLADRANFGAFVFSGTDHTTLLTAATFDTRAVWDLNLTTYIAGLLGGQVANIGP